MFKAIYTGNGKPIIILDERWDSAENLDRLREHGSSGNLVCQGCKMKVRVRAGNSRRRHFAHWQLADCPLERESEALLSARAALYKRLTREFGNRVTIEYQPEQQPIPQSMSRPIDCWVNGDGTEGAIAYWIFDQQMRRASDREGLKAALKHAGATYAHFVFIGAMRRPPDNLENSKALLLSTTERDFLVQSAYGAVIEEQTLVQGFSLHYMDQAKERLITYRNLSCVHGQQLYTAKSVADTPLDEVLVDTVSGELFHPGEAEQAAMVRVAWKAAEVAREQREAETRAALERIRQEADHDKTAYYSSQEANPVSRGRVSVRHDKPPILLPRMLDIAKISAYQQNRIPRELISWARYVRTILTDDEAVGICGANRSDIYLVNIWHEAARDGLSQISDTDLIIAHKHAMEIVKARGLEEALVTIKPLPCLR